MRTLLAICSLFVSPVFAASNATHSAADLFGHLAGLKKSMLLPKCPNGALNLTCGHSSESIGDLKKKLSLDKDVLYIYDDGIESGRGYDVIISWDNNLFLGTFFPAVKGGSIIAFGDEKNSMVKKIILDKTTREAGSYLRDLVLYLDVIKSLKNIPSKILNCQEFLNSPESKDFIASYPKITPEISRELKLQKIVSCKMRQSENGSYGIIETDKGVRLLVDNTAALRSIPAGESMPDLAKLP